MRPHTPLLTGVILLVLASLAIAQPRKGHLILGSISSQAGKGGIFAVDWDTGTLRTITTAFRTSSVRTMWGNGGILATDFSVATHRMYHVQPNGSIRTVYTHLNGDAPQNIALDQAGRYVGAAIDGRIHTYYLGGGLVSTLANAGTNLTGFTRDERTGDYFAARYGDNRILRIDRLTGQVTTFASLGGAGDLFDIAHVTSTNEIVAATFDLAKGVQFIRPNGTVRRTIGIGQRAHSVTYDQVANRIFVGSQTGTIVEYDANGNFVWSRNYPGFNFSGIDVWGDQSVSINTTGRQLSLAVLQAEFPESPNRPYCAALSLSNASPLRLGQTQHLHLAVDQMFLITACGNLPFWTRGFSGTTNATGRAVATFVVPSMPLGTRVYAGAVAFNPTQPDGLDVSNVEVFEVTQ